MSLSNTAAVRCAFSEMRPVVALVPNPKNPNTHPEGQVRLLAKIISATGWRAPIVVSRRSGFVVKGHGRLMAAKLAGLDSVPVDVQDYANEAEEWADMVADNRIAELAEIDSEALKGLLVEMQANPDADMELAGFDADALAELDLGAVAGDEGGEEPEPDAEAEPVVKPGELWLLGEHRLLCGDSTATADVARVGAAGAVLQVMDPPFDMEYAKWPIADAATVLYVWGRGDRHLRWMMTLPEPWKLTCTFVFTGQARGWARPEMPCLVHETCYVVRKNAKPAPDWSVAERQAVRLTTDGRPFSVQEGLSSRRNDMSWAKSPACMAMALCYTQRGDVVYDPCAGAGASLLASEAHGRRWVGIENQPRWCDLIIQRWEEQTGRKATLAAPNAAPGNS